MLTTVVTSIVIHNLSKLTEPQQEKVTKALKKGEPVLMSQLLKNKIIKGSYRENRGYSAEQIYDLILAGGDGPGNVKDGVIDIYLIGYYEDSSTIGWTTVNGTYTYINTKFLDTFEDYEVFGNIMHEYMHRLGFVHHIHAESVPYSIGYSCRDAFKEYYETNTEVPFCTPENPITFIFADD